MYECVCKREIVSVCVCLSERDRETARERKRETDREIDKELLLVTKVWWDRKPFTLCPPVHVRTVNHLCLLFFSLTASLPLFLSLSFFSPSFSLLFLHLYCSISYIYLSFLNHIGLVTFLVSIMVLILDGSSEHGAHIWSKSDIWICLMHQSSSPFFLEKTYFFHTCATCLELPSYISTMVPMVQPLFLSSVVITLETSSFKPAAVADFPCLNS